MSTSKTVTLSNGVKLPAVGFGTFASEGSQGETYKAVTAALKTGYRLLDCAWFYQNEGEIGQAIKDFLAARKDVKREDIFVVTKVWNHLHRFEDVLWSIENSLDKLQLDYVDMFLVHWPIAVEKETQEKPKLGADGKVSYNDTAILCPCAFVFSFRVLHSVCDANDLVVRGPKGPNRQPRTNLARDGKDLQRRQSTLNRRLKLDNPTLQATPRPR
jgi:hypothetical protein